MMSPSEMDDLLKKSVAAYNAMSPEQRADHDYEQRRSFVRGMCPFRNDYSEWCKTVDRLLPPKRDGG
jgi:hypothetical protein